MTVQTTIERKLRDAFAPTELDVRNESGMHNVPVGSETHFAVVVVSDGFGGRSRIQRHQAINRALAAELAGPVHALAIHAFTPDEWRARAGESAASPECRGGMASERSTTKK